LAVAAVNEDSIELSKV